MHGHSFFGINKFIKIFRINQASVINLMIEVIESMPLSIYSLKSVFATPTPKYLSGISYEMEIR